MLSAQGGGWEYVLDRAAVDLALCSRKLSQVRNPLRVRPTCREIPARRTIVNLGVRPFAFVAFIHGRGPEFMLRNRQLGLALGDFDTDWLKLFSEDSVTKHWIIIVNIDRSTKRVRVLEILALQRFLLQTWNA